MEFSLSEEQKLIIDTTKKFVETELFPHEDLVEKTINRVNEKIIKVFKKTDPKNMSGFINIIESL